MIQTGVLAMRSKAGPSTSTATATGQGQPRKEKGRRKETLRTDGSVGRLLDGELDVLLSCNGKGRVSAITQRSKIEKIAPR